MAQHDGKPYQPRRGPERPPQPAAPADGVDHLAMVAAEAEAMVAAAAEAEEEPMNPFEEEPEPGLEKDDLSDPGLEKDDLAEPGLEKDDLSEPGLEKDDLSEPEVDMEEDELEEEEEEEEEEEMEEEEDEAEGEGQHEHHGGNGEALPMDVEAAAAAAAAATAAGALLDPHGTTGPATVHPTNQLTLSFQGEVYVFDSVSPDKVQAVLLLLGGRELNPGASSSTPYSKRLNYPHRVASLLRFREKRKERNFDKKIRYSVRKEVAQRMQRKRGQFTSSKPRPDEATSELPTPDGSTNWASLEEEAQPEAQPVQLVPPRPPQVQAMNPNEQEGAEGLEPDFHPEELQGQSGGEDGRVDPMELFIVPSGPPSMRKNSVRSRGKGPAADGSGRAAQRPRTNEAPEQGGSVAQITAADKLQSKDSGHRGRGRPAKRGRIGESRICKTSRKNDPEFQKTRAKEAAASRKVVKEAALSKKRAKKASKKRAT